MAAGTRKRRQHVQLPARSDLGGAVAFLVAAAPVHLVRDRDRGVAAEAAGVQVEVGDRAVVGEADVRPLDAQVVDGLGQGDVGEGERAAGRRQVG